MDITELHDEENLHTQMEDRWENFGSLDGIIDTEIAVSALGLMEIDELGLDPADRNMLRLMNENYGDKPVGLSTIAALTGDEATTIEDYYEPYLLQLGLLARTPRGRVVTEKGRKHLQNRKNVL